MLMTWHWGGGRSGKLAQCSVKTEAGKSLCILAFLQETNIIFRDIKGLFVVSSLTENENTNMDTNNFCFSFINGICFSTSMHVLLKKKTKQIYIRALFFQLTCLFFLQFILYD